MITPIKIDKNNLISSPTDDDTDSARGTKQKGTEVIVMDKPKTTDWFIVYGDSLDNLHLCDSVQLKGDDKQEHAFLVYGGQAFKDRVKEDFGGVKRFWPVLFKTKGGRCGIWNVNKAIAHFGSKNSWLVSSLNIVEFAQSKWVRIKSNLESGIYDCWVHSHQESCPPKEFEKSYEEYIIAAWGDYILTEEGYEDNQLDKDHLDGVKVKQEIKESKK